MIYSIFFPKKTILSTGDILVLNDGMSVDKKILYNFFSSKELIKSELVTFAQLQPIMNVGADLKVFG